MTTATMAADGGDAFLGAFERDDLDVIEATLSWGGDVLEVRHLPMGSTISIGEHAYCTFFAPAEQLGTDLAVVLDPLGPHGTALQPDAPFAVDFGPFRVALRIVPAGRHTPFGALASLKESALGSVGTSFVVHAMILGSLAMFLPSLGDDGDLDIARDRIDLMQKYLAGAAERERDVRDEASANEGGREAEASAKPALGESGAMGSTTAPKTDGHWSAKGDASPRDATLARQHDISLARDFGILGLLASAPLADPNAPIVPWGAAPNGADPESHRGAMWGYDARDSWGIEGIGISGVGEGGCLPGTPNCGQGVGFDIGEGIGRALRNGQGDCVGPNCGRGNGHGHLGGVHTPQIRHPRPCEGGADCFEIGGRIPAEVIQRIVRQNAGRYRACYEAGLRDNPSLNGHVRVKFVIARDGSVSTAQDSGSDLPDERVRGCVVKSFYALAFPTPEGGTVRVTYPIIFSPTD